MVKENGGVRLAAGDVIRDNVVELTQYRRYVDA